MRADQDADDRLRALLAPVPGRSRASIAASKVQSPYLVTVYTTFNSCTFPKFVAGGRKAELEKFFEQQENSGGLASIL
jgi:hypothetical protein